jgi:diphosphomevalonate decarboxylase
MPAVVAAVNRFFPQAEAFSDPFKVGTAAAPPKGFNEGVVSAGGWEKGAVKQLIHTRVGDGPRCLGPEDSLLNAEGIPKVLA